MTDYYKDIHRTLVSSLVSRLAWESGKVVAARGVGTLPRPEAFGGFEPDVIVKGEGFMVIGEAKASPSLDRSQLVGQLSAWKAAADQMPEDVTLALAVPAGWRPAATAAAQDAGWSENDLSVLEVGIPGGPPPPQWR
jgi:hypothetical protein